jgi:NADPH:quinone reductase-like Zn-dependent oxidoreductase
VEKEEWDLRLKKTGFNGLDFSLNDTGALDHQLIDVMVSTVPVETEPSTKQVILLQPVVASEEVRALVSNTQRQLLREGFEVIISDLKSVSTFEEKLIISLLEIDSPLLTTWSEEEFNIFKALALKSAGLLWITRGGGQMGVPTRPAANAAVGFFRVIRAETPHLKLPTLDLSETLDLKAADATKCVWQVFESVFVKLGTDREYAESCSALYIPRAVEEKGMNSALTDLTTKPTVQMQPLHQPSRHMKLDIGVPGMLDTLHFIEDPEPLTEMGPFDVEYTVHATALNFRDIMIAMGQIANTGFGSDSVGRVTRVGSEVTRFKVGQMVCSMAMGSFKTTMRSEESFLLAVPDHMSREVAASYPCIVTTAYFGLYETARLAKDETVLIHAAAGGLGQIAIQMAQNIGAEVFATVGSIAKKELIMDKYGIPEDHIFNSRDLTFAKGVMRMTGNRGVNVVLNSLSGEALRQTWLCLAPFGRFVEVGKRDIMGNTGLDMAPFLKNVTFASVNLEEMQLHPKMAFTFIGKAAEMMNTGAIKEVFPISTFNYSEIERAFRTMQTGKHIG